MEGRRAAEVFPPGEYIREELEARGWTQVEFAEIIGRPLTLVNEIISGKRGISPETARCLGDAFGTSAQFWLNLEAAYRLSRTRNQDKSIAKRARLYTKAPIRDMVRRNWIEPSDNVDVLEKRLLDFFEIESIDDEPTLLTHAARRSAASHASHQTAPPAQLAWLFRARRLAQASSVHNAFSRERFEEALEGLRAIRHSVDEIRRVPRILADAGIRFLIVEPLPRMRIDGACFWLDAQSPVVVLSMRYDRIDYFWHTLMHELGHVKNKDGISEAVLDVDLMRESPQSTSEKPDFEKEADRFASEALIPGGILWDFVSRVRPLYSKAKIREFAAETGVHPGIVVGQLQYTGEISYSHSREMLVKVRHIIEQLTLTDGWGSALPAA